MRKETINGYSYSEFLIYPKNWKTTTSQKSLKENWMIYDPKHRSTHSKGFQFARNIQTPRIN